MGLRGLGAEVAKNLILAGVRALTMLDPQQVRTFRKHHGGALGPYKGFGGVTGSPWGGLGGSLHPARDKSPHNPPITVNFPIRFPRGGS